MRADNEILADLWELFAEAEGIELRDRDDGSKSAVVCGCVSFRFQDMPRIAAAFGTEHLNFTADPGNPGTQGSTWTGVYGDREGELRIDAWEGGSDGSEG